MTSKEKPPVMDSGGLMAWIELLFTDEFGEDLSTDYADFTDFWRSKFFATILKKHFLTIL